MLFTYFDLFNTTQIIYYQGPNDKKPSVVCTCRLDNLSDTLTKLSEQYKDSDIHLYGNQTYGEGLKETIENSLITKYSNNNIKIYVN